MIFSHRANHPAHFSSTQPSQLSREAEVNDLYPEIVLGTTYKHDVVGLDIRFGVHDDVEVVVGTVDSFATVFESFHFVVADTFRSSFVADCKAIDCVHCCKVLKVLSVLCVAFSIYF